MIDFSSWRHVSVNSLTTLWNSLPSRSDRHKTSTITQYRTPIYTASLPPVECAMTVRALIFLCCVTPCCFVDRRRRFGRTCNPCCQCRNIRCRLNFEAHALSSYYSVGGNTPTEVTFVGDCKRIMGFAYAHAFDLWLWRYWVIPFVKRAVCRSQKPFMCLFTYLWLI